MRLYLVQHAEAMSENEDPSRGLSEEGFEHIRKVAAFARGLSINVGRILHSGKKRAFQTAEVLAEHIPSDAALQESDGLAPKDDPGIWSLRIADLDRDTMIVGHLPHLSGLASKLLGVDRDIIGFENAGIVCMKRGENGSWSVDWILKPRMFA